ncbi:MAG: 4Fe-4S binding protein [Methanomicrobiaceae archaeon]|nr:4Fe-4S binding protein [Methanomicrobiaceae archaeon]
MALNIGCSARPGKARDNRTGSWRVFKPVLDPEKCSKCGMCILLCPEGCIEAEDDDLPKVDFTYCKGCGLCTEECPQEAIEMVMEEK